MTTTRRSTRSKENGRKSPQKASASKKKFSFSEDDEKLAKALGRRKKMKNSKATPTPATKTTKKSTTTTTTTRKPTTRSTMKEATKANRANSAKKSNNKPNLLVGAYVMEEGDEASLDAVPVVLEEEKETGVRKKRKKEVEKRRPKLSEKSLEGAAKAKFGERLSHNVGFPHWPVPCDYGAVCQFHRYLGLKDVRYGVCECQSCGIALCTRCFRFYHTEKYVTGKRKEKLRKKIEEAEEKFQKTRRYKGKRFSDFLLEQSKKA